MSEFNQIAEETLDTIAGFMKLLVMATLYLAVFPRRKYGFGAAVL